MSSSYREAEQEPAWNWVDFALQNVRLLLFLGLALAGMFAVYRYFIPQGVDAANVAVASGDGTVSLAAAGAEQNRPVRQRYAQSPGPTFIAIISGHMDSDAGAVCDDGLTEAEVNERIARLVIQRLAEENIEAEIFSEFDSRLDGFRGTALISIHADSCVYYNELATGYKIAASNFTGSNALMECMEGAYGRTTGLPYNANTITPHMTDYHAFRKIAPTTPAIIIETGFMNLDRELLTQRPEVPVDGVVSGIRCFLDSQP